MKRLLPRRAFLIAAGTAACGAGMGCRLQRSGFQPRTFLLEAPGSGGESKSGTPTAPKGALMVRPFRVAPAFDAHAFVVRRGDAEYTADPFNSFLLSPGPMLTEAVSGWIRALHAFSVVMTGGSQVSATHALEGEVPELYGDYREAGAPKAVLTMQLRLLHPLAPPSPVVWQRTERRVVDLPKSGAEELVAGWRRALGEICQTLEPGLFLV